MVAFVGEREFSFHGAHFAAKEWGKAGDFPIIAMHGWLDNSGSFDVLAPLLNNVHIVALDAAGHGFSSHRRDHGPYNIWQDVTDLYHVVEQLGWQRFALLGHSRGAMISTLFAGTFPDRVSHLALIDSIWPMPVEAKEASEQLKKSILGTQRRQGRNVKSSGSTVFPDQATAIKVRQKSQVSISFQAAQYLMQRGIKKVDEGYVWSTDPNLLLPSAVKLSFEQIKSFVDNISAQTVLVLAKDGFPELYEKYKATLKQFPQVEIKELEGGHHLHLENAASEVAQVCNSLFHKKI